jgi:hypothetical protein
VIFYVTTATTLVILHVIARSSNMVNSMSVDMSVDVAITLEMVYIVGIVDLEVKVTVKVIFYLLFLD